MNWYEILADPNAPVKGLVSVRISSDTPAAEGVALLADVVYRAGLPEAIALWVDGERVGVCRTTDILDEAGVQYRGPGYGGTDPGNLPGPPPSTSTAKAPYYLCPRCGHSGYIAVERFAVCENDHPMRQMVRQP